MLVDVGPKTPTFDAGERVVVPNLHRYGIQPDLILLTHPDTDHVGGLSAVLRAFPYAPVLVSAEFRTNKHMIDQLSEAQVRPDQLHWLPSHVQLNIGESMADIICPSWRVGEDTNDGSIVARISSGSAAALLMGDAPFKTEYALLGRGNWKADILKVGHHGSRFSTSKEWLAAVTPTWAVVSCGENNRYGHPHRALLQRLEEGRVQVLRTDHQGDIWFRERNGRFAREN